MTYERTLSVGATPWPDPTQRRTRRLVEARRYRLANQYGRTYAGTTRLDDVEFLVRSTNRLDVLDAIRTAPRSRDELREDTDVSRVTLSRILADFEDRRWIARRNGHYESTPEGTVVAAEVGRLFGNLAAVDALGPTLRWLPTERFDFELGRLAGAEVMVPDGHDLTAQIRWVSGRIAEANRVRAVATWVASRGPKAGR